MRKHYNKVLLLSVLSLVGHKVGAQTGFHINGGANIVMSGASGIVLTDCNFTNDGSFVPAVGTLKFTGSSTNSTIGGSGVTTLYNLTIDEPTNDVLLSGNISVENNVTMLSHHIDLNTFDLDLGTTGMLIGENENSRITGSLGGQVLRTEDLNAPSSADPGNLGLEITTTANLGITQIARGHVQQTGMFSGIGIDRYFDLIPAGTNNGLDATLVFNYFDAELAGNTEADLGMSSKPIATWFWAFVGDDGLNTTTNKLTKQNIDSFNRFTLSSTSGAPLPLTLLSFTGQLIRNATYLKWNVAGENGILKYELEKSPDGKTFTRLASLTAKGLSAYHYIDEAPFTGYTYYRLRVHENSKLSLSQIVKVATTKNAIVNVYPNPAIGNVTIGFYSDAVKDVNLKLLDVTGKLVAEKITQCVAGDNQINWDISALAQATYYLQIDGDNTDKIKLIKL